MKKVLLFGIWASLLLVFACSDDETPFPLPTVNFMTDPAVPEVGVPIMFENLTTNAARYEWDFGGTLIVDDQISPTVTFETPGDVVVTLRAFTDDGQVDSTTQTINIQQRVITQYFINSFPLDNGGTPWDPAGPDSALFADLVIVISPNDQNNQDAILDGVFLDVEEDQFGINVAPEDQIVLTDEEWSIVLFDFDGELGDPLSDENTELVAGATFNPVQQATVKNDAENAGIITTILGLDGEGRVILDVDIVFELR